MFFREKHGIFSILTQEEYILFKQGIYFLFNIVYNILLIYIYIYIILNNIYIIIILFNYILY